MATLATEMPALNTAEARAGVTTPVASQPNQQNANGGATPGIDSIQSIKTETANLTSSNNTQATTNNTISAAADSSDNQPDTPQSHLANSNEINQNSPSHHHHHHHPYANHHIYANLPAATTTTTASNAHLQQMYNQHIYSQSNMELHHHQGLPQTPTQHTSYPSYLNSYEQFYQQQQQQQQHQQPPQQNPSQSSNQSQNPQQMDFINSNSNSNAIYNNAVDYKQQPAVRYHPYLLTPTSGIPAVNSQNSNSNNALDGNSQAAPVVSSASSSLMSPRIVSSTSPTSNSNQMQISGSASSIGSMSVGNPSSPNAGGTLQCKKCGLLCIIESELQEHIANVHGASPYGSSGYASSPYIKEELQQQTPPNSQMQQQQQQQQQQQPPNQTSHTPVQGGGNAGEILDLDSQKMLYPPSAGSMAGLMHQSLGNTDPLHGLHNMQQRAGMNSWDQQSQEGLPPYLHPEPKNLPDHSSFYQSAKQSPYHVTNSSIAVKAEYQTIIKSEYPVDSQQYMSDKSFDPTAPNQQQQMMPPALSSSPAEFPSTTSDGPQDDQQNNNVGNQQFRAGNFEPPSSSSATVTTRQLGGKAANWKSNEARRPKTYNCTACTKWFTSSGHLKRHYNTTLHKNAVKSSGQPDPASLPISVHHHPSRDPTGKSGRRAAAAAAAAAANASNNSAQQQQQAPQPVQPPEPPNSPQDYGRPQEATGGLTPLPQYTATPSPNSMYQQQQQQQQYQQHQYMPQVQSTTNASPQHASPMNTHNLHQQQPQQHNQTVMNGHPNALAGLSVSPTQQTMPMPSSQMRGLLHSTMPSTLTTTVTHITKNKHLEAALIKKESQVGHLGEVEKLVYFTKEEVKEEYSPKTDMGSRQEEQAVEEELAGLQESEMVLQQQELADQQAVEELMEVGHNVSHHHITPLTSLNQIQHYQLEQQHQGDMERLYHNTTPSSMQVHSPLIISHQQYQEHLQQQQIVAQDTFTLTQTPPPPQQHNSTDRLQPFINMRLGINTQQPPNNMLQLQPPHITEQRLPPLDTIIPITTNMVNMVPPNHHHMQPPQQQHTELQPLVNTQQPLDTINTNIPSQLTTTTTTTSSMPSFHQLQQQGSVLPPLDHTLSYPHTIIGNAPVLTLDSYGNFVSTPQQQQLIQIQDGQLVQVISATSGESTSLYATQYDPNVTQRSPQQGDLPPMIRHYLQEPTISTTLAAVPPSAAAFNSPANTNSLETEPQNQRTTSKTARVKKPPKPRTTSTSTPTSNKRKRNPSTSSAIGANSTMLPNGRIKCIPCNKEFTKICYLTQHNTSFHSGEYPFRCEKCGKRYQLEDVCQNHTIKHTIMDKAFKCQTCPKQFHHKTDLRRHIEAIHTGNKQHVCDICQKGFCRKDHLRKHIETHNRPRALAKKAKAPATTAAKASNSFKDTTPTPDDNNKDLFSSISIAESDQFSESPPPHGNDINSFSSPAPSTSSSIMLQIYDVAADNEYKRENNEFITLEEYGEQINLQLESQYDLGSQQTYEIIEHEMPMY